MKGHGETGGGEDDVGTVWTREGNRRDEG